MSAALPAWLDPSEDFDPLTPAFIGRFVASLDYDAQRELTARGGGRSGGAGRSAERRATRAERQVAKLRAQLAAERQAKTALRSQLRSATTRARRSERALAKQRAELAYAQRFKTRAAQKRIREQAREIERLARYEQREAAKTGRALRAFFTPASRRSSYQRRRVAEIERNIAAQREPLARKERPGRLDPARRALAARLAAIGSGRGKPGMYLHLINDATVQRLLTLDDAALYNLKRLGNEGVTPPGVDPFAQLNRDFNETLGTTDYNYVGYNTHRKPVNPLWLNSGGTKKRSIYGMPRVA
jgi:hypothetical protein